MGRPSNTWINELMSSFRRSFVKSNLESSFLCANHMHGCLSDESSGKRNQRETIKWLSPCVSSSLSFHLPIPPVLLAPHSPRSFTPSSLIPPSFPSISQFQPAALQRWFPRQQQGESCILNQCWCVVANSYWSALIAAAALSDAGLCWNQFKEQREGEKKKKNTPRDKL